LAARILHACRAAPALLLGFGMADARFGMVAPGWGSRALRAFDVSA
jgi:hypothetical protein